MLQDLHRALAQISYGFLAPAAVILAIMPLGAEPHLLEKLGMLTAGTLRRPIDIFDLFMHGGLLLVLGIKGALQLTVGRGQPDSGQPAKGQADKDASKSTAA
jgi:hypothetical protein